MKFLVLVFLLATSCSPCSKCFREPKDKIYTTWGIENGKQI